MSPLAGYVAAVFLLSWAIDVLVYLNGGLANPKSFQLLVGAQMMVPALVAVVFRRWVTKEGFAGTGLRWGRKRYYLVAVGVVLAWLALSVGVSALTPWLQLDTHLDKIHALMDKAAQATGKTLPLSDKALLGVLFVQMVLVGAVLGLPAYFGEEYGWRGYLLPKLLPMGRIKALVLHGVVWGLWHAPIIAMGYNYPGHPVIGILMMTVFCGLVGVVFGWLYYASGSIWTTCLAHGVMNQGGAYLMMVIVASLHPLLGGMLGLIGQIVLALFILWLFLSRRLDVVGKAALS